MRGTAQLALRNGRGLVMQGLVVQGLVVQGLAIQGLVVKKCSRPDLSKLGRVVGPWRKRQRDDVVRINPKSHLVK